MRTGLHFKAVYDLRECRRHPTKVVITAPPGHPVARQARCPLAALDGQPFICFDRDSPTRRLVDRLLRRHRVRVHYVMELDKIETIKRSIEAGLGLSLLPAPTLAAEIRARTLVSRAPAKGPLSAFARAVVGRQRCSHSAHGRARQRSWVSVEAERLMIVSVLDGLRRCRSTTTASWPGSGSAGPAPDRH
jgi:DNA-binding transcriptional LysR family regulator